jgi:phage-related minor tail protein
MEKKNNFQVAGDELLKKIKEIIHEGNVNRIIIKNEEGKTYLEIPITIGVIGAVLAPVFAAIGALAALAARFTIEVERVEDK